MATVAATGLAVTAVVAILPSLHFAYRQPRLHVAVESAASVIALVVAFLVFGRVRRTRRSDELALACSLALLALVNCIFGAIADTSNASGRLTAWASIIGSTVGASLFCAAAYLPDRRLRDSRQAIRAAVVACLAFPAVVGAVTAAVQDGLPPAQARVPPSSASGPTLTGHPSVLALQLLGAIVFAGAGIGFMRRAERRRDELLLWLAVAAVLAALARVNYFLYPSRYSDWVYVGDGFRLTFYIVLLVGAAREVAAYWERAAAAAALEERRRTAHEVHDGVAQEIAYIRRGAALLGAPEADAQLPGRIRAAAARAEEESRRLLEALDPPRLFARNDFEALLVAAVEDVAARHGSRVEVVISPGVELDPERTHALLRIACEATANAARHGEADLIELEVSQEREHVALRVSDRGRGFSPSDVQRGFGLKSMRERAESAGGRFSVESQPGEGTRVKAVL